MKPNGKEQTVNTKNYIQNKQQSFVFPRNLIPEKLVYCSRIGLASARLLNFTMEKRPPPGIRYVPLQSRHFTEFSRVSSRGMENFRSDSQSFFSVVSTDVSFFNIWWYNIHLHTSDDLNCNLHWQARDKISSILRQFYVFFLNSMQRPHIRATSTRVPS